jgi:hypothetical protein
MKRHTSGLLTVGMLAMALIGGAVAQWASSLALAQDAQGMGQKLVASELVIVDQQGRPRMRLGMSAEDRAAIALMDEQGRTRMSLGLLAIPTDLSYWSLAFFDEKGTNRFTCGANDQGSGSGAGLWDNNARLRFGLGFTDQGNGGLVINDSEGRQRFGMGMPASGGCSMSLADETGEPVWSAP